MRAGFARPRPRAARDRPGMSGLNVVKQRRRCAVAFSRRSTPESCSERCPSEVERAQGMPGAGRNPWPACKTKTLAAVTTGSAESTRHSPRNGFNGFFRALPGDRAFLPPSRADRSARLAPASGCQDHTTSPSALASFVRTNDRARRHQRPSHPASRVVTIAIRPSYRGGTDAQYS